MKSMFRPWGLGLFAACLLVIGLVWLLLLDVAVKWGVERAGTDMVGARVELDRADVSLMPLGVVLSGLAVTDPDHPMTNAVEVASISFGLDAGALWERRLVIDRMRVDGVRLNTPRARSGAIQGRHGADAVAPPAPAKDSADAGGPMALPDIDAILKDNPLESVRLAQTVSADIDAAKKAWDERLKTLPDEQTLASYRERLRSLKGKNPLKMAAEMARLKKDLKRDVAAIKTARNELDGQLAALQQKADQAANAPRAEARKLAERYGLPTGDMGDITALLLEDRAQQWVTTATRWYQRIMPLVARAGKGVDGEATVTPLRGKGVTVQFDSPDRGPELLIRETLVNIALAGGSITGTIANITPDQALVGMPTTFSFSGDRVVDAKVLSVAGTLDHMDPETWRDLVTVQVEDASLSGRSLAGGSLPLTLVPDRLDLKLDGGLTPTGLSAKVAALLKGLSLKAERPDGGGLARALVTALADVDRIRVDADISGTPDRPTVRLRSDLDRLLGKAAADQAEARLAALTERLEQGIAKRVAGAVGSSGMDLSGLQNGVAGRLDGWLQGSDGLLGKLAGAKGLKRLF